MISIRHGWQDNKKQNCRLLNQDSSERTARVQIIADSNCILLFFQSLKAIFQKQKKLPRVRHYMRNRRLSWTRASKTGKRARKPGAKLKQALCAAGVNLAAFAMFAIRASKTGKRARKPGAKLKQALCAAGVNLTTFVMCAMFASFKARKMFGISRCLRDA